MNKYGGIADISCDKRIYNLWYQMLRRCYDAEQHKRTRGSSYSDCEVSDRWMILSHFERDIKHLKGYKNWISGRGYCLDKDTKIAGNKVYSRETCCFIPIEENIRDISRRNPNITKAANESHKVKYALFKDEEVLIFDSEKEACKYLGVVKCSVASCYRKGYRCKGYRIAKMDGGEKKNE